MARGSTGGTELSHPKCIFIDGADHLARELDRRISYEVRKAQQCERRAKARGETAAAERHRARWIHFDTLGGHIAEWTVDLIREGRSRALQAMIESWPPLPKDTLEVFDNEMDEAAD
jgi:hypothetical protein